jgi:hypothetical protein
MPRPFLNRAKHVSSTALTSSRQFDIPKIPGRYKKIRDDTKSGIPDREQGVLRPPRGHTGQSATHKTDGALHYRGEERRSLTRVAGGSALPAEIIFQSNSMQNIASKSPYK